MATLDLQVAASTDDCRVSWNGSAWAINLTLPYVTVGYYESGNLKWGSGMRFLSVTVPKGATITEAHLTTRCPTSGAYTAVTVNTKIVGNAEDNAATFSTIADYQARRGTSAGGANNNLRTTAEVLHNAIGADSEETDYNSPDIKTIIQEIIDRAGWVSGNALALFWDDHDALGEQVDSHCRLRRSYDGSTTYAPKLHIEYPTPFVPFKSFYPHILAH